MAAAVRTYRTTEFACLAGVTPRALRHYDRLGLLKPKRSQAGYRIYAERDLESLEEIVALKFIGVPLKEIAAIRRRKVPFVQVLTAQRQMLEAKRRMVTHAISAVAAAEASLRAGAALDVVLLRRIIEVMHMDKHEDDVATYSALLKAKTTYLSSLTGEQRDRLKQQWATLIADVRQAIDADPASSQAQGLLDRWLAMLGELAGSSEASASDTTTDLAFAVTPEVRDEVWARRAEWLPADVVEQAATMGNAEDVLAQVRARADTFAGSDVMEFIRRARAARRLER